MASFRSRWAVWVTTAAPWSPASCSGCFSKPQTSWWVVSSPPWRYSRCSLSSCWHAPKASPARPSSAAYDGDAGGTIAREPRDRARLSEHDRRGAAFPCAAACRRFVPTVRRRLLGRDRDPRLRLLGVGVWPQPGRRVRRPDCDRLGGAAHARSLHHEHTG